ncbi:hypothetical protein ABI59_09295 [Acidobacteria bacterium Mor1]|nr:hypothetical protein ABI59_09295 [Acidobacteria bacterium Mor1]
MPEFSNFRTLDRRYAEALIGPGLPQLDPGVLESLLPAPVQQLSEIRATGFDAVAQFSDQAITSVVVGALRDEGLSTLDAPLPQGLDPALEDRIRDVVGAIRATAPVIAWPIRPGDVPITFEADDLRIRARVRGTEVTQESSPSLLVRLTAAVVVRAIETAQSFAARVDLESFRSAPPPFRGRIPVDAVPETTEVHLGDVGVTVIAPIQVDSDEVRLRVEASMDTGRATTRADRDAPLDRMVAEHLGAQISRSGRLQVAPEIAPFGSSPSLPLAGISRLAATAVGVRSNRAAGTVLSIGMEMTGGTSLADPAAMRAFTGWGTAAFFSTEPVIRASLESRWARAAGRRATFSAPFNVARPGGGAQRGAGRVSYEIGGFESAWLDYGSDSEGDTVLVRAGFRSRVDSAVIDGEDVSSELGDLAEWREESQVYRLFPDRWPVREQLPEIDAWLLDLGKSVIPTLLRPFTYRYISGDYHTEVSAALGAMATRGVLA